MTGPSSPSASAGEKNFPFAEVQAQCPEPLPCAPGGIIAYVLVLCQHHLLSPVMTVAGTQALNNPMPFYTALL